jgi:hypothetical protein
MAETIYGTATIVTAPPNDVNYIMTQSSWSFLSNDISLPAAGKLNFRGICCIIIGLISIGCEAAIISNGGE